MLSKEVKDLEMNGMGKQTIPGFNLLIVEYRLTKSGFTMSEALGKMLEWVVAHPRVIMRR